MAGQDDIQIIEGIATSVFGDTDKAQEWLETALPTLGGRSPLELCDTVAGRELVQATLRKIAFGEFA